jgi:hypothetical protein
MAMSAPDQNDLLLAGKLPDDPLEGTVPFKPKKPKARLARIPAQGVRLTDIVQQAVDALANDPELYTRAHRLVRVVQEQRPLDGVTRPAAAPHIAEVKAPDLRERLTRVADWTEYPGERRRVRPPIDVVHAALARKVWPNLRPLELVTETPILAPGGRIIQRRGYDRDTGVLYRPPKPYPTVPTHPSADDVRSAAGRLLKLVVDFPFHNDLAQAAWLAALLTPMARLTFRGPSPLFLVDANIAGVGKTLLVKLTCLIATGREPAVSSYSRQDEEMRKRITALLLDGTRVVLLDNLADGLGSPALDALLTSSTWKDRILGESQMTPDLPNNTTWYATGNNVAVEGDTSRRVLPITLDSHDENPEDRDDFQHRALLTHVRKNRLQLLVDGLTILMASLQSPTPVASAWGSYEGWSGVVRPAVMLAGLPDPAEARYRLRDVAQEAADALETLLVWLEAHGRPTSSGDLLAAAETDSGLNLALALVAPDAAGHASPNARLGRYLRRFKGRPVRGRRLMSHRRAAGHFWFVEPL